MSAVDSLDPGDIELIAGEVLGELTSLEREKLSRLPAEFVLQQRESLSETAAVVSLMFAAQEQATMPDKLRNAIRDEGFEFVRQPSTAGPTRSPAIERSEAGGLLRREYFAWMVAAAALMVVAGLWIQNLVGLRSTEPLTARKQLIASASDAIRIDWSAGKTPFADAVTGDVVWSNETQEGYMRFVSMPVNDPRREQYQLWIIDPDRDEEPIDGGVFDIPSEGEVIVPINAKLRVLNPVAFAVTIEKPGGVVVSSQERLPLLATVD